MKILLIGECYSANLGDPILCYSVQQIIKRKLEDAEITLFDISGRIDYETLSISSNYTIEEKFKIKLSEKCPRLFLKFPKNRAIKQLGDRYYKIISSLNDILDKGSYDIAIFAGGSLFMDYFAMPIYLIVGKLSQKKIPIIFHACGMSELSKTSIRLLRKSFSSKYVKSVSLRDSYEKFKLLFGDEINAIKTYDTALCCESVYPEQFKFTRKIAQFGIGVIGKKEYYELQKSIIKSAFERKVSFRIFTNGAREDYKMAVTILEELGVCRAGMDSVLLERPCKPEQLILQINGFNKIISFRMHSQIIAMSYSIECHGFVWDEKVKYLYDDFSLKNSYSLVQDSTNYANLFTMTYNIKSTRETIQEACNKLAKDLINAINISIRK